MGLVRVANNVSVQSNTLPLTSLPIKMDGANAVSVDVTVLGIVTGGSNLQVTIQGSNDLENWFTTGISGTNPLVVANTVGTIAVQNYTTIGYAYVRLVYTFAGTAASMVCAINANTYLA